MNQIQLSETLCDQIHFLEYESIQFMMFKPDKLLFSAICHWQFVWKFNENIPNLLSN